MLRSSIVYKLFSSRHRASLKYATALIISRFSKMHGIYKQPHKNSVGKVPVLATNKKHRRTRGGGGRRTRRSKRLQIPATCSTVSLTQILPLLVFSTINETLLPSLLNIYNANGFSLYRICNNVQIVNRNNYMQNHLKHNFINMRVAEVHSFLH